MGEHHDVHFLMVEDKRNIIVGYGLNRWCADSI